MNLKLPQLLQCESYNGVTQSLPVEHQHLRPRQICTLLTQKSQRKKRRKVHQNTLLAKLWSNFQNMHQDSVAA